MNRKEAEDFIYKSYMRAERFLQFDARDGDKRHPALLRQPIIEESKAPTVLVTGSKGKGSVANMTAAILKAQYRTGLMTSPHILSFCERFKINGCDITDEEFTRVMNEIAPLISAVDHELAENVCISPIGIQVLLALKWFNAGRVERQVFECGKGVRFDDTNNIPHKYSVINTIFPEHTRELGPTIRDIASDKAHIITGNQTAAFTAEQEPSVMEILMTRAREKKVPLRIYGRDFYAENIHYSPLGMNFDIVINGTFDNGGPYRYEDISIPLMGDHQARNCALAMAVCHEMFTEDMSDIYGLVPAIRTNLSKIRWPGRMEILRSDPFIMLDACINPQSCIPVKQVLNHLNMNKVCLVVGIPDDKDFAGVVKSMAPYAAKIILTRSQNPHYIFTQKQESLLGDMGIPATWTDSFEKAISMAYETGLPILILGTTSLVGEAEAGFMMP